MIPDNLQLPYRFDTTQQGRIVLMGLVGGAIIMLLVAFVLFPLLSIADSETQNLLQIAISVIAIIDASLAPVLFRLLGGARGEIDRGRIQVEADQFLGLQSSAPSGLFSPHSFTSIRTVRVGKYGSRKVFLVGVAPIDKLAVGVFPPDRAEAMARYLSENLPLKLES